MSATAVSDNYRYAVAAIWERVVAILREKWRTLDWADIEASFRLFLDGDTSWPGATSLVTAGQASAQEYALAFVREYVAQAGGTGIDLLPADPSIAGTNRNGDPVSSALMGAMAAAWLALGEGKSTADAMDYGEYAMTGAAANLIADAGAREVTRQTENREFDGWTWRTTSGSPCEFCSEMDDGRTRKPDTPFSTHSNCHCQPEPVLA